MKSIIYRQESVLVLSLGKLIVRTEPRLGNETDIRSMHQAGANQEEIMAKIISYSYDRFTFEILDVQVSCTLGLFNFF